MTESESNPLNLRIHLQQIPVGIPEEQRAMAERLVRRRLEQIDTVPHQLVGAAIDVSSSDALPVGVGASFAVRPGRDSASVLPPI
jgi:hypothetical protein